MTRVQTSITLTVAIAVFGIGFMAADGSAHKVIPAAPPAIALVPLKPGVIHGPVTITLGSDDVAEITDAFSESLGTNGTLIVQGGTLTIHNPNVTVSPVPKIRGKSDG